MTTSSMESTASGQATCRCRTTSAPPTNMIDTEVTTYLATPKVSLPHSVVDDWELSWQTGAHVHTQLAHRITFPIWGYVRSRRPLMVVGRVVDPDRSPKYWNTPGARKSQFLYGLWRWRTGSIPIIVEGYTDCWALALLGLSPLAIMGSTMSRWQAAHVASLSKHAILLPDSDARADSWADRLAKFGVRTTTPAGLYPVGSLLKADPHWLWVNARAHLVTKIEESVEWLTPRMV